jgi:hypothetical protein
MCWNKEVSLNTFLFSSFVLGLIMYNNAYTQYKIDYFNNIYVCIFFISFISIQLVEYFIWVNVNNPFYNNIFTSLATLLLLFQPIATNLLINNDIIRKRLLYVYLLFIISSLYKLNINKINSGVSKLGHLQWNTKLFSDNNKNDLVFTFIWTCFFLFPLFYEKYNFSFIFGLLTFMVIIYNFYKDNSVSSMWCWIVNSIMIYHAAYLLVYLPFFK